MDASAGKREKADEFEGVKYGPYYKRIMKSEGMSYENIW